MEEKPYRYRGKVIRVADGDTLDVEIDPGFNIRWTTGIRLAGIDAPETFGVKKGSAEYEKGLRTTRFVEEAVLGKTVFIRTLKDRKGKFGRRLAEIHYGENRSLNLNDELASVGPAKKYES